MELTRSGLLRKLGSALVVLAAMAFLFNGANALAQQVAAEAGFFPVPSAEDNGSFHAHGSVSHSHSETGVGHVHHPHDDDDHNDRSPVWSFGCMPGLLAFAVVEGIVFERAGKVEASRLEELQGVAPPLLSRPPSIPNIA